MGEGKRQAPGSCSICLGRGSRQRRQKSIAGRRNSRNRGTEMGKRDGLIPNPRESDKGAAAGRLSILPSGSEVRVDGPLLSDPLCLSNPVSH